MLNMSEQKHIEKDLQVISRRATRALHRPHLARSSEAVRSNKKKTGVRRAPESEEKGNLRGYGGFKGSEVPSSYNLRAAFRPLLPSLVSWRSLLLPRLVP